MTSVRARGAGRIATLASASGSRHCAITMSRAISSRASNGPLDAPKAAPTDHRIPRRVRRRRCAHAGRCRRAAQRLAARNAAMAHRGARSRARTRRRCARAGQARRLADRELGVARARGGTGAGAPRSRRFHAQRGRSGRSATAGRFAVRPDYSARLRLARREPGCRRADRVRRRYRSGRVAGRRAYLDRAGELVPLGQSARVRAAIGMLAAPARTLAGNAVRAQATLEIALTGPGGGFAPASLAALLLGANRLLLGGEVLQFAAPNRPGRGMAAYRPAARARGNRGRRACRAPRRYRRGADRRRARRARSRARSERSGDHHRRDRPQGRSTGVCLAGQRRPRPQAARPGASELATESGEGALTLGWTRRARGAWDWLDGVEAPLVEESELYRVGYGPPTRRSPNGKPANRASCSTGRRAPRLSRRIRISRCGSARSGASRNPIRCCSARSPEYSILLNSRSQADDRSPHLSVRHAAPRIADAVRRSGAEGSVGERRARADRYAASSGRRGRGDWWRPPPDRRRMLAGRYQARPALSRARINAWRAIKWEAGCSPSRATECACSTARPASSCSMPARGGGNRRPQNPLVATSSTRKRELRLWQLCICCAGPGSSPANSGNITLGWSFERHKEG